MTKIADIVVVGGGIAGASIAAELASSCDVLLLEMEDRPGYHSTGRSAAIYIESYGPPPIRKLSKASKSFLAAPPAEFEEEGFLSPRGILYLAGEEDVATLDTLVREESCVEEMSLDEAVEWVPILKRDWIAKAAVERGASDIDVARLHQAYLRALKHRGGEILLKTMVSGMTRKDGVWNISTASGDIAAPVVINAAGAWADELAALAGIARKGLSPMRRTGAILPPPQGVEVDTWPLVADMGDRFYFKPDAGKLMVSPADETPVPPGDAYVDDMELAEGLYRFEQGVTMPVERVERTWAGLRTFAPDRVPLVGFDEGAEGFFWFAGQGGYGIQTAPGMAMLGASLALGNGVPAPLQALGLDVGEVAPGRAMENRLKKH